MRRTFSPLDRGLRAAFFLTACWPDGCNMLQGRGGEPWKNRLAWSGAGVTLEGVLVPGTGPGGVVITHPHPLFGGSMANNVVWAATRAFVARGMAALRFNFRGVGRSTGTYGGGSGGSQRRGRSPGVSQIPRQRPLLLSGLFLWGLCGGPGVAGWPGRRLGPYSLRPPSPSWT